MAPCMKASGNMISRAGTARRGSQMDPLTRASTFRGSSMGGASFVGPIILFMKDNSKMEILKEKENTLGQINLLTRVTGSITK